MKLLRRRRKYILAVYASEDMEEKFDSLRKVLDMVESERLGSLYDPEDPRRNLWEVVNDFRKTGGPCLHLGIHYNASPGDRDKMVMQGHLFLVKNVVPDTL